MNTLPVEIARAANSVGLETTDAELLSVYIPLLAQSMDADTQDALRFCAITRWFNLEIIGWLRGEGFEPSSKSQTLMEQLTRLTFTAPYLNLGYAYHEDVRAHLLSEWQKNRAQFLDLNKNSAQYFEIKLRMPQGSNSIIYGEEYEYHLAILGKSATELVIDDLSSLKTLIKDEITKQSKSVDGDFVQSNVGEILKILERNITSGRYEAATHYSAAHDRKAFLHEYVVRLVKYYLEEQSFIKSLQQNSEEAWSYLRARVKDAVYYQARRRFTFSDPLDQEDVAQDVSAVLIQKVHGDAFPYDIPFDAWLNIIVRNIILRYLSKLEKQVKSVDLNAYLDQENRGDYNPMTTALENLTIEEDFIGREKTNELINTINALPTELQKRVLLSIFVEELQPAEIAQKLGKSVAAIYSIQFNALRQLRKNFTSGK